MEYIPIILLMASVLGLIVLQIKQSKRISNLTERLTFTETYIWSLRNPALFDKGFEFELAGIRRKIVHSYVKGINRNYWVYEYSSLYGKGCFQEAWPCVISEEDLLRVLGMQTIKIKKT